MQLRGATALVTGANRDLGRHFARELLERGAAKVYATARRPELVDLPGVEVLPLDVTDLASVAAAAAVAGDVTLLVNNAGVSYGVNLVDGDREVRDQAIGIIGDTGMCAQQALMFRQLSDDVVLFLENSAVLDAAQATKLRARGIDIVEEPVAPLEIADDELRGVRLRGGRVVPRTAIVVLPRSVAKSLVLASLGLEPVPFPAGDRFGEYYESDPTGATAVPGSGWRATSVISPHKSAHPPLKGWRPPPRSTCVVNLFTVGAPTARCVT